MTGGAQKKKIRGFGVAVDDEITRIRATIAGLEAEAAEIGSSIGRFAGISEAKRAERSMVDEQIARYRMLTEEFSKRVDVLGGEKQALEVALRGLLRDAETGGEELRGLRRISSGSQTRSRASRERLMVSRNSLTIPRSRPSPHSMRISGDLLRISNAGFGTRMPISPMPSGSASTLSTALKNLLRSGTGLRQRIKGSMTRS
ncbi:MAG: hypothetical protein RQM90_13125 [Methanoculleus sp.]